MLASLKGSAASEVDDALREHEGHKLVALPAYYTEDDENYEEPFLRLKCDDCGGVDILELVE